MYVRAGPAPLARVLDTCPERTTLVPYNSSGGASAADRDGWNRNAPAESAALTASARRFMSAACSSFRITQAEGDVTASGSLECIFATSCAWKVSPSVPVVEAVCDEMSLYVGRAFIC